MASTSRARLPEPLVAAFGLFAKLGALLIGKCGEVVCLMMPMLVAVPMLTFTIATMSVPKRVPAKWASTKGISAKRPAATTP